MVSENMSIVRALVNHMQFMYDSIDSGNFVISVVSGQMKPPVGEVKFFY